MNPKIETIAEKYFVGQGVLNFIEAVVQFVDFFCMDISKASEQITSGRTI